LKFLKDLQKTYVLKIKERLTQHFGYTFIWRSDGSHFIHKSDFTHKILKDLDMLDATLVKALLPLNFHCVMAFDVKKMQQAIGILNYIALHTRLDIAFTVNILTQFASNSTQAHWSMVKH
jgi:hypothetical protein